MRRVSRAPDEDPLPSFEKRQALAHQLGMTPRSVQIWFQNRRQRLLKPTLHQGPGDVGYGDLETGMIIDGGDGGDGGAIGGADALTSLAQQRSPDLERPHAQTSLAANHGQQQPGEEPP